MRKKYWFKKMLLRVELWLHPNKCRLNSEGMYEQRKLVTICLDSPYEVEWVSSMSDVYAVSYKLNDEIKQLIDLTKYKKQIRNCAFQTVMAYGVSVEKDRIIFLTAEETLEGIEDFINLFPRVDTFNRDNKELVESFKFNREFIEFFEFEYAEKNVSMCIMVK